VAPYVSSKPRGVTIKERYEPAPSIAIDSRVLARVVVNLVENALQAMDSGGRLTISVTHDPGDDRVELSVADTGHGLGPEVRSRLFEPYFSTKSSGTGLGLAISRRAVEAHGGSIEVSSESGQGATFRVRIPALRTADGAEPASD
jgi:signal transduction histidine kinase